MLQPATARMPADRGKSESAPDGRTDSTGVEDANEHASGSAASTEFPYFTEEHELIRQTVTRFCQEEIAPFAAEWDEEGIFPRELFTKAGELGMFGIRIDPKWGGSGQDWWATAAYVEAMAHSDSGSINMAFLVQSDMALPVIQELGTDGTERGIHSAGRRLATGSARWASANPAAARTWRPSRPRAHGRRRPDHLRPEAVDHQRHARRLHRAGGAHRRGRP